MGLFDQWFREEARENKSGKVNFSGYFVTSTNGALVAASSFSPGFTLTRTAAGRYTLQLVDNKGAAVLVPVGKNTAAQPALTGFKATIIAATAETTAGKGIQAYIRGGLATLASAGNFIVQFATGANPPVDGDVEDGAAILIEFSLKCRSQAVP